MPKQRPILYSTPMVIAVQREVDPKTQTRRTKGLEHFNENSNHYRDFTHRGGLIWSAKSIASSVWDLEFKCPYGQVGDLLWVREKFETDSTNGTWCNFYAGNNEVIHNKTYVQLTKWKPSIHMPKKFARIWLQITDIKVERLKDISEADAIAEGVEPVDGGYKNYMTEPKMLKKLNYWTKAYFSFLSLWESINGYESSELNPWVWVITFKRVEKP